MAEDMKGSMAALMGMPDATFRDNTSPKATNFSGGSKESMAGFSLAHMNTLGGEGPGDSYRKMSTQLAEESLAQAAAATITALALEKGALALGISQGTLDPFATAAAATRLAEINNVMGQPADDLWGGYNKK